MSGEGMAALVGVDGIYGGAKIGGAMEQEKLEWEPVDDWKERRRRPDDRVSEEREGGNGSWVE